MQEAANMPFVLMCQDEARKQASIVYQFQSIWDVLEVARFEKRLLLRMILLRSCRLSLSHRPCPSLCVNLTRCELRKGRFFFKEGIRFCLEN